jgi:hypothetical protein
MRSNSKLIFLILYIMVKQSNGQGVSNQWVLGYDSINMVTTGKTTIDFSGGFPSISWSQRAMNFGSTNAVICDTLGNLLFYTNGVFIANAADDTMLNGDGLNPSNYTNLYSYEGLFLPQADLVLPYPGDAKKYYLIHQTIDYSFLTLNLYYSIIDMSLDGGLGAVISKNNILYTDSLIGFCITCLVGTMPLSKLQG